MKRDQSIQVGNAMKLGEAENLEAGKAEASDHTARKIQANYSKNPPGKDQCGERTHISEDPGPLEFGSITNKDNISLSNPELAGETMHRPDLSNESTEGRLYKAELIHSVALKEKLMFMRGKRPLVHFNGLARINIVHLQKKLAKMQFGISDAGNLSTATPERAQTLDLRALEDTLHKYTTAIRDYEYMARLEDKGEPGVKDFLGGIDQELFSSPWKRLCSRPIDSHVTMKELPVRGSFTNASVDPLRKWLMRILPASVAWTEEERYTRAVEYYSRLRPTPNALSPSVDRIARFIIAITGGLSLVGPMLIMGIHQNTNKSLITTSVAVVLFSGVVSILFKASNAETLAITAAYAAVLVVFVGTSS